MPPSSASASTCRSTCARRLTAAGLSQRCECGETLPSLWRNEFIRNSYAIVSAWEALWDVRQAVPIHAAISRLEEEQRRQIKWTNLCV